MADSALRFNNYVVDRVLVEALILGPRDVADMWSS